MCTGFADSNYFLLAFLILFLKFASWSAGKRALLWKTRGGLSVADCIIPVRAGGWRAIRIHPIHRQFPFERPQMQQDAIDCATQASGSRLILSPGGSAASMPALASSTSLRCELEPAREPSSQAMERYNVEKDIAAYIKKEFDKKYNPTWHCIVGRNFGSYVTHETKNFIYFYLGQVGWRARHAGHGHAACACLTRSPSSCRSQSCCSSPVEAEACPPCLPLFLPWGWEGPQAPPVSAALGGPSLALSLFSPVCLCGRMEGCP